jgi:hypothetical protein
VTIFKKTPSLSKHQGAHPPSLAVAPEMSFGRHPNWRRNALIDIQLIEEFSTGPRSGR